ncbi:hypothetical protein CEXT_206521 [Caerostris extrusa]|uniref:Uncharacterized protein n=1 Tax=Caerostris extrusa TaxID=172846 RepID=A0AAV4NGV3_CAEEX|nr:hypothetical protein CEXT_206521 [Caerostris extrusa]
MSLWGLAASEFGDGKSIEEAQIGMNRASAKVQLLSLLVCLLVHWANLYCNALRNNEDVTYLVTENDDPRITS